MTTQADAQAGTVDEASLRRLHWQCRRGMRELDELLGGFLQRGYAELAEDGRRGFDALLACPDPLLYEYFFGDTVPIDKDVADVVRRIRAAAGPAA